MKDLKDMRLSALGKMIWPFQREPIAPDGSPLSEWDCYEYSPQPDITTFELAALVGILMRMANSLPLMENPERFYVKRNAPSIADERWPIVSRHFKKVETVTD